MVGCESIGQTAPGGDANQVQADLAKMPLEDRVKIEMGSPAPMDQKLQRIKDMYDKEGKTVPPDIASKLGNTAH